MVSVLAFNLLYSCEDANLVFFFFFFFQGSAFGFSAFMVCALGPSGWILSHLQEYKKRD
uniref:Uncharacterized protein n=1 Tax=Leptobrachium leishanense TaxID=445787 RepID=A0A8C5QZX9_9ANUR